MDRSWRPERAVPVADALDELLDHLESIYEHPPVDLPAELLPFSTGILALDQVCGGGLRVGTVTLLDCTLAGQSQALLYSAARQTQVPALLAVSNRLTTARWLLAGCSEVPATLIGTGQLSEKDWRAISSKIAQLAARQLQIAEVASITGLRHVAASETPAVLLTERPERLGPIEATIHALVHLAESQHLAVLCSTSQAPDLSNFNLPGLIRVVVAPYALGSRATLIRVDDEDGLTAARVEIALLDGTVS